MSSPAGARQNSPCIDDPGFLSSGSRAVASDREIHRTSSRLIRDNSIWGSLCSQDYSWMIFPSEFKPTKGYGS